MMAFRYARLKERRNIILMLIPISVFLLDRIEIAYPHRLTYYVARPIRGFLILPVHLLHPMNELLGLEVSPTSPAGLIVLLLLLAYWCGLALVIDRVIGYLDVVFPVNQEYTGQDSEYSCHIPYGGNIERASR